MFTLVIIVYIILFEVIHIVITIANDVIPYDVLLRFFKIKSQTENPKGNNNRICEEQRKMTQRKS